MITVQPRAGGRCGFFKCTAKLHALVRRTRYGAFAAVLLTASASAPAQTPDEHAEHHPAQAQASVASPAMEMAPVAGAAKPLPWPGQSAMPQNAPAMGDAGGMMNMGEMMRDMTPPARELYPALMQLPELASQQRAGLQRRAEERMASGLGVLGAGLDDLSAAAPHHDYAAMQGALQRLRLGIGELDSALATQRALSEGQASRELALSWFRREMNLAMAPAAAPHWGLSAFHYLSMVLTAALALALTAMAWMRQHRASALAAQLAARMTAAPAAAPPRLPASSLGGWSGMLRVARIFDEIEGVKTFRLAPLSGEDLGFSFEPGQFLTVSVPIGGKAVRRSYSIASSPCCHGFCDLTVKHASAGAVSGYLHERLRVGDVLEVSGPYGRFTFRGHEAASVVMIAGGVGVTPMMSAIRYLTDQSWPGEIFLIYACPHQASVIFRDELDYLARRHPNLHVTLVLSDEPAASWHGARGYVTAALLQSVVPDLAARRIHLCGPPPMMQAVKHELAKAGVPESQLKSELFLSAEAGKPSAPAAAAAASVNCRLVRSGRTVSLVADQTVLEAAEAAGVALDASCRQGFCGVCKARLLEGQVAMAVEDGLAPADKAAGYILTCQAKAQCDLAVDA